MWKPLEVAANPSRYFRRYGVAGLANRVINYPLRPLSRALAKNAVEADRRYYAELAEAEGSKRQSKPKILFYPVSSLPIEYAAAKMLASIGAKVVTQPSADVRLAVLWEDATHVTTSPIPGIRSLNAKCCDISKTTVARAFGAAFGYGLEVDPASYSGPMVEKSDDNGLHDGRIVQGPLQPLPGRVYQRLIDNQADDRFVLDLRTPLVGGSIPFVYLKYRPIYDRFSNSNTRCVRKPASDVFSPGEISGIITFAKAMGLDYGELDVLRDRNDGRIYIVDVAKTPFGPPNHLDREDGRSAIKEMGEAFEREFLA